MRGLFVSGGSTGPALFKKVAGDLADVDEKQLLIGQIDERIVPTADPDSNTYHLLPLFKQIQSDHRKNTIQFLPMITSEFDAEVSRIFQGTQVSQEPERYDHEMLDSLTKLAQAGAALYSSTISEILSDSVAHLGLGPDGHIASLFPGSAALHSNQNVDVNLDRSGINKHLRISLTFKSLAQMKSIVVVATGSAKAAIVRDLVAGADLPASKLPLLRTTWIFDLDAAQLLDERDLQQWKVNKE